MLGDDVAISIENLNKCYTLYDRPEDRLKQSIVPRLQRLAGHAPTKYYREFWALRDVSFEVRKGATLGIIGRNGSGKSTLLQIICGTLHPTSGSVISQGRIAALLELGSGFNPEFTGRENVYMNGAILGLSKQEINARFDSIAAFADIGEFMDQPLKCYSSGMSVRLAFAVITHVDADILVIDEALAVGDVFFQQKCMRFLRSFQDRHGTVLFVSHDVGAVVSLCDRAILLIAGSVSHRGNAEDISKVYLSQLYANQPRRQDQEAIASASVPTATARPDANTGRDDKRVRIFQGDMQKETRYLVSEFRPNAERFGHGGATIKDAGFLDKDGRTTYLIKGGDFVQFYIRVDIHTTVRWPAFGFMIKNSLGEFVFTEGTDAHFRQHELVLGKGDVATSYFSFTMPHMNRGKHLINVAFAEGLGDEHIQHCWMHDAIELDAVDTRLAHGYCGMTDTAMRIEVSQPEPL